MVSTVACLLKAGQRYKTCDYLVPMIDTKSDSITNALNAHSSSVVSRHFRSTNLNSTHTRHSLALIPALEGFD